MFDQYNESSNYMTYDSSSLNQYNYKNMDDRLPVYQQYQNQYYFTNKSTQSHYQMYHHYHEIQVTYPVIYGRLYMMVLMVFIIIIH